MTSGGNICDRCAFIMLLLFEILIASLCLRVIVSDEMRLMPLSVFMLPHLLNLRMFESDIDFDVRIDDCVPAIKHVSDLCDERKNLTLTSTCYKHHLVRFSPLELSAR